MPYARHSQLPAPPIRAALDNVLSGDRAAVVLITDGPSGETIILNAPSGEPLTRVPLAVLGPKPGARAIEGARRGEQGRLVVDGEHIFTQSDNLIARIARGPRFFVVSTPRTGWTPAVAERGPGTASFLAMSAWASKTIKGHTLLFVNTTAHEFDNAGGRLFLNSPAAPDPNDVVLWVHFGAGFAARAHHEIGNYRLLPLKAVDPQRFLLGSDDLLEALATAFAGHSGLENPYPLSAGAAGELEEIADRGYAPLFGLFGAHAYHHVMTDRMAMTNPVWIRNAALSAKSVAERILGVYR